MTLLAERISAGEVVTGEGVILVAVIVVLAGLAGWALARAVHVAAAVRARRGRVSGAAHKTTRI